MPLLSYSFPYFLLTVLPLLPLARESYDLPLSPRSLLCPLSTLVVPRPPRAAGFFTSDPHPRAQASERQKRRRSGSPASARPGLSFEFNYSSPHYTRKGRKLREYNYFLPRAFAPPFIGDLMRRSIACRARVCADFTRQRGVKSRALRFVFFFVSFRLRHRRRCGSMYRERQHRIRD